MVVNCPDCGTKLRPWHIGDDPIGWHCPHCRQKYKMKHPLAGCDWGFDPPKIVFILPYLAKYPQDFGD